MGTANSVFVADSDAIGDVLYDVTSDDRRLLHPGDLRAVVATVDMHLERVRVLSPTQYRRHFAVAESPLDDTEYLLVLAEGELVTALRACVADSCISAIHFDTTQRTTEWLGSVPELVLSLKREAFKTNRRQGGIFAMVGDGYIKSIGVAFYKLSV